MRQFVSIISILVLVSGCGHSAEQVKQNLTEASKQCSSRAWPNAVAHVTCLDSLEEPVIQKQIPVALDAFRGFSVKRRYLAQQADTMNAIGIAASAKYRSSYLEAFAVLKAHEPKLADSNSTLAKEWSEAKAPSVCKQDSLSKQVTCIGSILRPIWERNAPETIAYYDEYQQKHLGFAHSFDASGALESNKRTSEYFVPGMKQALAEFRDNAQRDIQAANQRDAAAKEQALQTFGNILAGVAAVTLAVAEAKATQQQQPVYVNTSPTHCVSRKILETVYTDCQ